MENNLMYVLMFGIVGATIVICVVVEAVADYLLPARMERFKLENYKDGIDDAISRVRIDK